MSIARRFGFALLDKGAEEVNLKSFRFYDRMLPAQDSIPEGGLGNLIALPLQGQALKAGNSAFVDENWNAYRYGDWRHFQIRNFLKIMRSGSLTTRIPDISTLEKMITDIYAFHEA